MSNTTAQIATLTSEVAELKNLVYLLLDAQAPAKTHREPASSQVSEAKADDDFVTWLRATGEARAQRKVDNKALAEWLRSKNLPTSGPVWEAAKGGNRSVRSLRALAKKA